MESNKLKKHDLLFNSDEIFYIEDIDKENDMIDVTIYKIVPKYLSISEGVIFTFSDWGKLYKHEMQIDKVEKQIFQRLFLCSEIEWN